MQIMGDKPYEKVSTQTYLFQSKRLPSVFSLMKKSLRVILCVERTHVPRSKPILLIRVILCALFLFLFSSLMCCFSYKPASAFHAEVLPKAIEQGDAFLIKVTNVDTADHPVAFLNKKRLYFSLCGDACFVTVGAIDVEKKPGTYPVNVLVSGQKKTLTLVVKPAHFPTLNLTLPDKKVFLSKKDLKRVKKEQERLSSLFQVVSEKIWDGAFILPLDNEFSTLFGTKRIMNKKKISIHRGLDIRGKLGETVRASNNGRVVLAEELFFGGNTVIIDHGQGIYTFYMHLSKMNVRPGSYISKGETVGYVGASGRATGPHLHFGVKVLNVSTNPLSIVGLNL